MGDINVRPREPQDNREDKLSLALAGSGLVDVTDHFAPRWQYQGTESWTWQMRREVRMVTGRGDYILSSYRDDFIKEGVRYARLHTDHRIFLAVL